MSLKRGPDKDIVLAIDTGGTNARVALVGLGEGIIGVESMPIDGFEDKGQLTQELISKCSSMMKTRSISQQRLAGVGHSSAGVPNEVGMFFTNAPNMPSHFLPFGPVPIIADHFNLNTNTRIVLNDCSGGALGEHRFGHKPEDVVYLAQGSLREPGAFRISERQEIPTGRFRSVCYYTMSTGENGGFVKDGVVVGRPELGHMFYGESDFFGRVPKCGCGATGCVEAVHSGTGVGKMILKEYRDDCQSSAKTRWVNSSIYSGIRKFEKQGLTDEQLVKLIPVLLYNAGRDGDQLALDISDWHNEITCRQIGNILASGYQPEIIAFGGSLTKSMDFSMIPAFRKFAGSVARGWADYTGNQPVAQLPVLAVCNGYGDDHPLLGAGAAVFNKLYGGDI